MNSITIRTEGTEITVNGTQVTVQAAPSAVSIDLPVANPYPSSGHTKITAEGIRLTGSDPRTDHVAVIDHSTGLMWAVESIGDKSGEPMSQADCIKAVAELRLLGHDDWRLPTRAELAALVDETRTDPAIDTALFPRVKPRWHWTGTDYAGSSSYAWFVLFYGGNVDYNRRYGVGFALAVRRAGQ